MAITARHRILEFLGRQPGSPARSIGRALGLSDAAVRHHLRVLCSDGRVVRVGQARGRSRGRPAKLYRVSERVSGDNLALIADGLLASWPAGSPEQRREAVVSVLAEALLRQLEPLAADVPLTGRLRPLVEGLNGASYQARWEAGAEGPRILLGHCPYAAIIGGHPELCAMDARVMEHALETNVTQTAKINLGAEAPTKCVFLVRATGPVPSRKQ